MNQGRLNRTRQRGRGAQKKQKEKTEEKRWFSVTGEFSLCSSQLLLILRAASTYVGLWAGVDHMKRTVGQVKASEAARPLWGSRNTIEWVTFRRSHYRNSPSTPIDGQLTMIHAWHNTGNSLINVYGYMVCIYAGAWCHMGLWTANRHDVTQTVIWAPL